MFSVWIFCEEKRKAVFKKRERNNLWNEDFSFECVTEKNIYIYIVILDCKIKIYIRFRIIFNWKNVNNSLIAH